MATIKQAFSSESTLTVTGLATLADSGIATSNSVDNTTNLYLGLEIDIELTGTGGSNTSYVDVYLVRGSDGTNFSTQSSVEDFENLLHIVSIKLNESTLVRNVFRIDQLPPHWKLIFENNSGDALTAATVVYRGTNLSN